MMQQLYGGGVQRALSKLREQRSECRQTLWAPVMAPLSLNLSMSWGNGAQLKPHSTSKNSWRDLQLKSPTYWFHCSHHLHLKLQDHLLCLYSGRLVNFKKKIEKIWNLNHFFHVISFVLAQKERPDSQRTILRQIGWTNYGAFLQISGHFFPGAAHLGPHTVHPCTISLCCWATINGLWGWWTIYYLAEELLILQFFTIIIIHFTFYWTLLYWALFCCCLMTEIT